MIFKRESRYVSARKLASAKLKEGVRDKSSLRELFVRADRAATERAKKCPPTKVKLSFLERDV